MNKELFDNWFVEKYGLKYEEIYDGFKFNKNDMLNIFQICEKHYRLKIIETLELLNNPLNDNGASCRTTITRAIKILKD